MAAAEALHAVRGHERRQRQSDRQAFRRHHRLIADLRRTQRSYTTCGDTITTSTLCGKITGFTNPQGMAVDASGDLYIANTDASNIIELAPPYTKLKRTLKDPGYYPLGVAVCKGYVAVTNIYSTSSGNGNVEIYAGTATSPSRKGSIRYNLKLAIWIQIREFRYRFVRFGYSPFR